MSRSEKLLSVLRNAEEIILSFPNERHSSTALHDCKIHIWKAIDSVGDLLKEEAL